MHTCDQFRCMEIKNVCFVDMPFNSKDLYYIIFVYICIIFVYICI